ncbi:MAG TPA: transcription antitermination factor NusB [Gemmatimonadales bacterium]|nr:transcription antitermination factor NusB [Gemmatimonadales bacterium]
MRRRSDDGTAARRAAFRILEQVREGRPFDAALEQSVRRLSEADRRLAHELAAGVLRRQTTLDNLVAPFVPRGWKKVSPALQDVLRLGAYQLTSLDRVPSHAAVSTSVALAREVANTKAGGFVNAVLRKVAAEPSLFVPVEETETVERLAATYSHPVWLVRRWVGQFGEQGAEALLQWNNTRPPLILQPARAGYENLEERWREAGIAVHAAPYGAGLITDRSRPDELPGFVEGGFLVQDAAQALVAWYADIPAETTLVDLCAAPGGKSVSIGRGICGVIAAEVNPRRAARLAENLRRAGSGREHAVIADARRPPLRTAAAVLLDAPCLGTGSFARNPDARWRVTEEALAGLAGHQAELLDAAAAIVAPGGLLVYATCSLEPEENARQVDAFLERHREFRREPPEDFPGPLLSDAGDLTIHPHRHRMDGAYAARLRRTG